MITVLFLVVLVMLLWVLVELSKVRSTLDVTIQELEKIKSLSLNPRTRISQSALQSGAETRDQGLKKLGRVSSARRVVVGGDPNSGLSRQLNTTPTQNEEGM